MKRIIFNIIYIISIIIIFVIGSITIVFKGPSVIVSDTLVTTVMETSALKFLARVYFSDEEIKDVQARNAVIDTGDISDSAFSFDDYDIDKEKIEVIDINGYTYKGKLMIINDPSRVELATLSKFEPDSNGKRVEEFVKENDAIAGINAGGFEDVNGVGKGGQPLGLIIKDYKIINGSEDRVDTLVAFDKDNKLVVGRMSGKKAIDIGIRDAVAFGPAFIINGKAQPISGSSGGVNPRTVIGQRKDGAVLLLVIDGRQAHSIGATFKDCMDIMIQYGAYNAANLDGGSSSVMVYNDEIINICASLYGSRRMPAAFIVKKSKEVIEV